eukprot:UC4_evm4s1188
MSEWNGKCEICARDIRSLMHVACADPACIRDESARKSAKAIIASGFNNELVGSSGPVASKKNPTSLLRLNAGNTTVICIDCFCSAGEVGNHSAHHPYTIVNPCANGGGGHSEAILEAGWSGTNELKLLEALDIFGIGNWDEVARFIREQSGDSVGFSPEECEKHYFKHYIHSDIPAVVALQNGANAIHKESSDIPSEMPKSNDCKLESEKHELVSRRPEFAGRYPLRGEYETEWNNDFEKNVKDIHFSDEDTIEDKQLKLTMLHIYNRVLDEREKRRKVALDNESEVEELTLNSKSKANPSRNSKKKISVSTENVRNYLRVFARFQQANEHEDLINSIMKTVKLRENVRFFQELRRKGISAGLDAVQYTRKRRRDDPNWGDNTIKYLYDKYNSVDEMPQNIYEDFGDIKCLETMSLSEKKLCEKNKIEFKRFLHIKASLISGFYPIQYVGQTLVDANTPLTELVKIKNRQDEIRVVSEHLKKNNLV